MAMKMQEWSINCIGCIFEASYIILFPMIILMTYMSLEQPLEYVNAQVLVDTQWVEDQLTISHVSVTGTDYRVKNHILFCNSCKIKLAKIFQEEVDYCLECWQERTYPHF
jgi:hypothetical protein